MDIDTGFDLRTDAQGKDPDTWSRTARDYHVRLWSKALPSGDVFELEASDRPPYEFRHSSSLGAFVLSSDAFIPAYTRYGVPSSVIEHLPADGHAEFNAIGYTIGGLILWPKNLDPSDKRWTINQARGMSRRAVGDRMDLTLECIRLHYLGEPSPMAAVLARYEDFFALFEDFRRYVEFWLLQDLTSTDLSQVRFLTDFDSFASSAIPQDLDSYVRYRARSIEFLQARNARIDALNTASGSEQPS